MKKKYPGPDDLKRDFGVSKEIPPQFQEEILIALSHFPELRNVKIKFRIKNEREHPFDTVPSRISLLAPPGKRSYIVNICGSSAEPLDRAIMSGLPFEARIAAIAHELCHILQYESAGSLHALKMTMQGTERDLEREADVCVIEHGLGFELYTHASYLRSIPGLVDVYSHTSVNRLHPNEILEALPPEQLQDVHRF